MIEPREYSLTKKISVDKSNGYRYFLDKTHPLSSTTVGKVYLHRHIASIKIGRWVLPTEEVHHADHDRSNNTQDNLEVLTASEHRNKHILEAGYELSKIIPCKTCLEPFKVVASRPEAKFCSISCSLVKADWPSDSALSDMVWEIPVSDIANWLNVTGSAVKKHCKDRGIETPGRGYWQKNH